MPVVGRPAPDDRVESGQDRLGVEPAEGPHLGGQPFPQPHQGRLARFDQQFAVVAPDGKPEEVAALVEADDARLVLVEGQPSRLQPDGQPRLDLVGLLTGVTQSQKIVGVSDQDRRARHRGPGVAMRRRVVADSGGLFHAVQRHVQ